MYQSAFLYTSTYCIVICTNYQLALSRNQQKIYLIVNKFEDYGQLK